MKNITANRIGFGEVEFKFTKTALIGVGSNYYAATRAQFRKLFRQKEGGYVERLTYGVHRTKSMHDYSAGAFHTHDMAKFGCITFPGESLRRLRRWALRKA
jgi:hypothetical protein